MSYEQWFDGAEKLVELLRANGDSQETIDETLALCADNPELRAAFMEGITESQPLVPAKQYAEDSIIKRGNSRYLARRAIGHDKERDPKLVKAAELFAETLVGSEEQALLTMLNVNSKNENWGLIDAPSLVQTLKKHSQQVIANDMSIAESALVSQAKTLEQVFNVLMVRAMGNSGETLANYMKLSLRAQNQCRMTWETLATIKNPTAVFAKQANINQGGNQQVNNHAPAREAKRAERTIEALE